MLTLSGHALDGHLRFSSTFSADRLTTSDGVLTLGAWGGGFYDRQHSHDYVHEAVASLVGDITGEHLRGQISVSGGKGVVPFGSDPPMGRPVLHSPVNHHWSQIMERPLLILGLWFGRVGIEGTLFDGRDGSEAPVTAHDSLAHQHPGGFPPVAPARTGFGQSRAVRVTWRPMGALEVRGSLGRIVAPGHHAGVGADPQQMWNLSARFDRMAQSGRATVMAEVGRAWSGRPYWTGLAEGQWAWGPHRVYYRTERTDRPEGPRAPDLFHPATDTLGTAAVGATRWFVQTAGYGLTLRAGVLTVEPILELGLGRVVNVGTPPVDLAALYGRRTLWSGLLAVRLSLGGGHTMGPYGALSPAGHGGGHHH
jgi:hypothetical protein